MTATIDNMDQFCLFGNNHNESISLNYWGTFSKVSDYDYLNDKYGSILYKKEKKYYKDLFIVYNNGTGYNASAKWLLIDEDPINAFEDDYLIAYCLHDNLFECNKAYNSITFHWYNASDIIMDDFGIEKNDMATGVDVVNFRNSCGYVCQDDTQNNCDASPYECNVVQAEVVQRTENTGLWSYKCIHVGWIRFQDRKRYVQENIGIVQLFAERYTPYLKEIELVAGTVNYTITTDGIDSKHSPATNYWNLPEKVRENTIYPSNDESDPTYDFKSPDGNEGVLIFDENTAAVVSLTIEVFDDLRYEKEHEAFIIRMHTPDPFYFTDPIETEFIIIGPNSGNRGVITFEKTEYNIDEDIGTLKVPVNRVNGSDGDITVEYYTESPRMGNDAIFGRDYEELGIYEKILHHECDYLPINNDSETRLSQKYMDIITGSGNNITIPSASSTIFMDTFDNTKYIYPDEYIYGYGCCIDNKYLLVGTTYPSMWEYGYYKFRIEYPFNREINKDQIWLQWKLPNEYLSTQATPVDYILSQGIPYMNPKTSDLPEKFERNWKGLILCDDYDDCVFKNLGDFSFQIGNKNGILNNDDPSYKNTFCLYGPNNDDGSIFLVDGVSLYIKRYDGYGTLTWNDGDSDTKYIDIKIINDDEYEQTESFLLKLSTVLHPNPFYNPTINNDTALININGPNDIALGQISFKSEQMFAKEGELFCIQIDRLHDADEVVYIDYECISGTANDFGTTFEPQDFEWISPQSDTLTWLNGETDSKCIYINIFKDDIYEDNEDLKCTITNVYSDYNNIDVDTFILETVIVIEMNGDQIRMDTPWLIVPEGTYATIVVSRQGFRGKDVSVYYQSRICNETNNECQLGLYANESDFDVTNGMLTFYANESFTNKTVNIWINDDGIKEDEESFIVELLPGNISDTILEFEDIPGDDRSDEYLLRNYEYDITFSKSQVWIEKSNHITDTHFQFYNMTSGMGIDDTPIVIYLNETLGSGDEYTAYIWRNSTKFDFSVAVDISCVDFTALEDRDYECNDTTLHWGINDTDIKSFNVKILDDGHWEHEEVFYIELTNPWNGYVTNGHEIITMAIITSDIQTCDDAGLWSAWSNCSVTHGTGKQIRSKHDIFTDPDTYELDCIEYTEEVYCQMDTKGLPVHVFVLPEILVLYEGDYRGSRGIVKVSLGAMPDILSQENLDKLANAEDDCVVKAEFLFNEELDISVQPNQFCWRNDTWSDSFEMEIIVDDDDEINDVNPRIRSVRLYKITSIDDKYEALKDENIEIKVTVYDDEYCDPTICARDVPQEIVSTYGYDDEIQDIHV